MTAWNLTERLSVVLTELAAWSCSTASKHQELTDALLRRHEKAQYFSYEGWWSNWLLHHLPWWKSTMASCTKPASAQTFGFFFLRKSTFHSTASYPHLSLKTVARKLTALLKNSHNSGGFRKAENWASHWYVTYVFQDTLTVSNQH